MAPSSAEKSTYDEKEESRIMNNVPLLNPVDLCDGKIPYPKALSPSSIMEFKACPQSFLIQYLYGIRSPTNPALIKGSLCHAALEQMFDLEPSQRTLEHVQNLLRAEWSTRKRKSPELQELFPSVQDEREWGKSAMELLKNYFQVEDPQFVKRPNPIQREVWVSSKLPLQLERKKTKKKKKNDDSFLVRGIVDRLDLIRNPTDPNKVVLRIVDYKTGKAPHLKYNTATNERILDENFYQLKIYALLWNLTHQKKTDMSWDLRYLRLFYLTNHFDQGQYIDMDMGATAKEREDLLNEVHLDLIQVWKDIIELVDKQDPQAFHHCDRPFCFCHQAREKFLPDSLSEQIYLPPKP